MKKYTNINWNKLLILGMMMIFFTSCENYLDVPLPANSIFIESGFANDKAVAATVNGVMSQMTQNRYFEGNNGVGHLTGLYTDELTNNSTITSYLPYYQNALTGTQSGAPAFWSNLYKIIYSDNLVIEGIQSSTATLTFRNQWLGEAYFLRAFNLFYLTNLYGDIPLVLTSDYKINNSISRSPQSEVYAQIISDLKNAQSLLPVGFSNGNGLATTTERVRPGNAAATALLARVYLYTGDWTNAEIESTKVINQTLFSLPTALNTVFLANSQETIWSLVTGSTNYVGDFTSYLLGVPGITATATTLPNSISAYLNPRQVASFETTLDKRFVNWVQTVVIPLPLSTPVASRTYYLPGKYRSNVHNIENVMLLRLAEQYLIRAEARAQLNNISGAQSDLNVIRTRAGLSNTTSNTQSALIASILRERRSEFFAEEGHRFFDLKRSGLINGVMTIEAPLKIGGAIWNTNLSKWPISSTEIEANPNLIQTTGY
jgi:hypothetical protein